MRACAAAHLLSHGAHPSGQACSNGRNKGPMSLARPPPSPLLRAVTCLPPDYPLRPPPSQPLPSPCVGMRVPPLEHRREKVEGETGCSHVGKELVPSGSCTSRLEVERCHAAKVAQEKRASEARGLCHRHKIGRRGARPRVPAACAPAPSPQMTVKRVGGKTIEVPCATGAAMEQPGLPSPREVVDNPNVRRGMDAAVGCGAPHLPRPLERAEAPNGPGWVTLLAEKAGRGTVGMAHRDHRRCWGGELAVESVRARVPKKPPPNLLAGHGATAPLGRPITDYGGCHTPVTKDRMSRRQECLGGPLWQWRWPRATTAL